ncbi:MAG: hypothetical protein J6U92_04995 [Clostridia bacterium]|nr:hypothetical protein [Clostridia bacterium]
MLKILFQGDSITDGNRCKEESLRWDLNHQIGHSYAYIIASTLLKDYPGRFKFINRAVAGSSENGLAERWQKDTLDENPDVLSILLGINGFGVDVLDCDTEKVENLLQHFDLTYRSLLDLAIKNNPKLKIVIIEPFCLPAGGYKEKYKEFMQIFSRKQEIVKNIANDYGAIFIPTQKKLCECVKESANKLLANGCNIDPNEYWVWDGIHPTEATQGLLAELWLTATKDILSI